MSTNNFLRRKKSILSKKDKSSIGEWDEKIVELCEKINSFDNYYTTSSCSGRVVLIKDVDGERGDLFVKVWHDVINVEDLKEVLAHLEVPTLSESPSKTCKSGFNSIKFKQEPPIFHVACKSLEDAEVLLKKAREVGWKRSGIISLGSSIVVELLNTEKLEFPIVLDGEVLVDDEFLEIVAEKANENLKKGWDKIGKLKSLLLN